METWKEVEDYEGLYEVSASGIVRSLERKVKHWRGGLLTVKSKTIQPYKSKCGYIIVGLHKKGVCTRFLVHRLVSQAFIPNPEKKPQVNHINGIKTDNRAENLEWNTRSENINHADKNNLRNLKGSNNGGSKLSELQVLEIRKIGTSKSVKEIGALYNVGANCITRILNKKRWAHI